MSEAKGPSRGLCKLLIRFAKLVRMSQAQCRAARALLNLKRDDLAKLAGVSEGALGNYEREKTGMMRHNMEAVRRTLEGLGLEFLPRDGVARRE